MPYAILAIDKPDSHELRARMRPAHVAYLAERKRVILAAGPLLDDDGKPHGGLQIIDVEERAQAEEFASGDPFRQAGLFESVQVTRWRKAFFDREADH